MFFICISMCFASYVCYNSCHILVKLTYVNTFIVSTSVSEVRAYFDEFFFSILSCCDDILATRNNPAIRSKYCFDSEIILVCQGDKIDGDIDYRWKCSYLFIMTVSIIYGSTNYQWNLPITSGYSDGNWESPGVPRLYGRHARATTDGFKTSHSKPVWWGDLKASDGSH